MRLLLPVLLAALLPLAPAAAQTADPAAHLAALRTQLAPGKQVYISRQLALTSAEEAAFWPIYDEHQAALGEITTRRRENAAALARAAGDDDTLEDLGEEAVDIELDEAALMERTWNRVRRALPMAKALRYLQLEALLSTLQRADLAPSTPVGG